MAEHAIGTVLLPPDPDSDSGARAHDPGDPDALRLIRIVVAHPDEWPWRRLTGLASEVPSQWSDLDGWRVQPLWQLAQVLGHGEVR